MSRGREMGRDGLELGVLAGRYRLVRPLGRGGMAEVHLAHDEVLDRDVAVKILLADLVTDESFLERFRREARAAAALSHPNIVAVHDTGDEDGVPFIVMELVHGRSLDALLSDGRVGRRRGLEICAAVCSALAFAHERGIVHLDIKPGNILIAADGTVKVTDFGIARVVGSDTMTTTTVLGTASYLSPEQARGSPVDERSDLYSLGVVLYELVTGRVPFRGGSPLQVALQHVERTPRPPSELTDLDPALEALILKVLAKDPAERHRSAQELRTELVALLEGADVAADHAAALAATTSPVTSDLEIPEVHGVRRRSGWADYASTALSKAPSAQTATVSGQVAPPDAVTGVAMLEQATGGPAKSPGRHRSYRLPYVAVSLLALVGLAVLTMLGSTGRVSVPSVIGLSEDEARRQVEAEGLTSTVAARVSSLRIAAGHVISSDPTEGAVVDAGHLVALIVSTGPPPPPPVVHRPHPPPPDAADAEDDEGGGRNEDEDQAEQVKGKLERAEEAAEEAKDRAEDRAEEAEDDRKNRGRGRG